MMITESRKLTLDDISDVRAYERERETIRPWITSVGNSRPPRSRPSEQVQSVWRSIIRRTSNRSNSPISLLLSC